MIKITKTTSSSSAKESRDSVKSNKPQKVILPQTDAKKPIQTKDEDIIVISQKPPLQLKGARVAHHPTVANVPTIKRKTLLKDQIEARQKAAASTNPPPSSSTKQQSLITSSFNKGSARVAHVPKSAPVKSKLSEPPTKPSLKDSNSRKVPVQVRQRILDKLVTEFVQFMPRSDAIATAQDEEYDMLTKSATRTGYCSSVSGIIQRTREMANNRKSSKSSAPGISHLDLLKGRHAGEISIGVNKHVKKNAERVSEYSEAELYEALFDKYIMTNEQLEENGYPLWVDEIKKDLVRIKTSELDAKNELYVDPKNPSRICCRCKSSYRIKIREDDVVENSDCVYHWGKFWKKKVQAQWIPRYTCCDMGEGVSGCSLGKQHVTQMQTTDIFKEFVEAPTRRNGYDERSNKIFALDCEMVYTSLGTACARLSVVDYRGDKVLDEIIKPPGALLDTNFRFSGLQEDEVLNAKLDLAGVQERFFELINRDTILIGHSLESDLKSLRIVHKNVIDTSVLFPHRLGPPYKRALKNLSSEILMEIIQEDVTGHDSAEDAQIALKLVLHKLKNE
uniref:Exonuclease domain-containing protein n=1 Tax=Panagrolaimus superbus TaxID=310955 RepID=A0A914YFV7_9BILA